MSETVPPVPSGRVFLFLQGPSSMLFQWIADRLEAHGHHVLRINICAGDRVFWRRAGGTNYRGTLEAWPDFLNHFIDANGVTEIVLLGEERPRHRAAAEIAGRRGLPVYAVEMGYLRPDWISVEIGGAGSNSHFPNRSAEILAAGAGLPPPDFQVRYRHAFLAEVALDLAYNLPNVFLPFLHPHYRWHALAHPLAEYWGWIKRFAAGPAQRRQTDAALATMGDDTPFFFYPLQLQTDYQIRAHSPFDRQEQAIEMVLRAFARTAAPDAHLLLKVHPLDNALIDWGAYATELAGSLDIGPRVHLVFAGDLRRLMQRSRGVVTINSTVGLQALALGKPVRTLGTAIYDVDRLTDQRPLDAFFVDPVPPDPEVLKAFLALIARALHERGDFYSREGARAAANAIALRIHERLVNEPGGYVAIPPRRRAVKIGPSVEGVN